MISKAARRRVRMLALITVGTLATAIAVAGALPGSAAQGTILHQNGRDAIPGQYLVTFKNTAVQQSQVGVEATDLANEYDGKVKAVWRHALRGFSVKMSEEQAEKLAAEPSVARVEQDGKAHIADTQPNPPSWGVDRIDQSNLPLDKSYTYPSNAGQGTTVYVIDTGIRKSHEDFGTRASFGPDYVDNDNDSTDCNGHGTHVAGSAVGTKYGVAKKANVVGLRVLACNGFGDFSDITSAVDWVKANAQKPAVVNMSLGGSGQNATVETAVKNAIASGVPFAIAAGNSDSDACNFTPARTPEAITVGNANKNDARHSVSGQESNYGPCLDIWGPGAEITSAWYDSDTASRTASGTSMASPHVAGTAALYLAANPSATPEQVRKALVDNATKDRLTDIKTGSPNLLLYEGFLNGGGPSPVTVANPGTQTGTVGKAVSLTNTASGGTSPYTWSATGLPAGLSIAGSSGTVSGTPTTAGTSNVTITAKDSATPQQSGSATFSWTVNPDGGGGGDAITNGGFEAGNLSGWTAAGTGNAASTVNSGAHGGTYAARLGLTSATNGESTISQTFTAGSTATSVSFWYSMTCPDTVTYAWAKATLKDNTSGTTSTPLAKTCTNAQGWKQVSAPVTAGHSYTLTLVNRDDNHPDDPVYTLFDDVSAGQGTPGGNDFTVAADPASVTVQKGQSVSSTISTTVSSGNAQSVTFTASGLPAGATATFGPATVNSGESSKLTISTTSSTPEGASVVTVKGDGADVDRTTTVNLTVTGDGGGGGAMKRISTDPYTDTVGQHATQVEADTEAWGNTIVSGFQSGRTNDGGASSDTWATSTDGGNTWQAGRLPNLTTADGGTWERASDPVIAYSAKHSKWLFGALAIKVTNGQLGTRNITVNSSSDGLSWSNPVNGIVGTGASLDKTEFGCDNHSNSPNYGTCYLVVDDNGNNNQLWIATSKDSGATWAAPVKPSGATGTLPFGFVVQPDGKATVIYDRVSGGNSQMAISSTNGGTSWGSPVEIASIPSWHQPTELRGNPSPTPGVDSSGKIYVVWPDCRFRTNCTVNDLVMSTSTDAQTWTTPVRLPFGTTSDSYEKYIPRLAVDPSSSGSSAKLALWWYTYENASCSSDSTCKIKVQYASSANGGSTWSTPADLSPYFPLNQIADTTQNRMVGDYGGGSFVNGKAVGVFSVGAAPSGGKAFDQAMYTYGPQAITGGAVRIQRIDTVRPADRPGRQQVRLR